VGLHFFNADPDPAFHLNAVPDPTFHFKMRIRILFESATSGPQALQGPILNFNASIVSVHSPSRPHFESRKLLNFDFNADLKSRLRFTFYSTTGRHYHDFCWNHLVLFSVLEASIISGLLSGPRIKFFF
jgi:hypothetical protein